ncbi:MAG TPA: hypothetical protein VFV01_03550 [Spirillospora sp.]|nr:hypothetical protein [Spirillospora sp.]
MEDGERPGDGDGAWSNPYPLPGQDADEPEDDPPAPDAQRPGVSLSKGRPDGMRLPLGGRTVASEKRRMWLFMLVPFLVAMAVILGVGGYEVYGLYADTGSPKPRPGSAGPRPPEPEPVSTVRPRVPGFKAVTSAKYGLSYDVPASWRVRDPGLLIGFEPAGGEQRAAMSATAEFRLGFCRDAPGADRAAAGFQQYVDGGLAAVAEDAARKWATDAYAPDGGRPPAVTLKAPKTVRVGRAYAVRVHADAVPNGGGACAAPSGSVDVLAIPGTGPGKTTVFVVLRDTGVPDAAPAAVVEKVIGSVRPS